MCCQLLSDEYWKQRGYAIDEHYDQHADVPTLYMSSWWNESRSVSALAMSHRKVRMVSADWRCHQHNAGMTPTRVAQWKIGRHVLTNADNASPFPHSGVHKVASLTVPFPFPKALSRLKRSRQYLLLGPGTVS